MKKIIMIIGMFIATVSLGYAQEEQKQMTKVDQIELPLTVQEDLTIGEYSDWEFVEAFEIPVEARKNREAYEVLVSRKDQIMSLFYDDDGKLVRQEPKENK